jgi:hypothetical protein
MKKWKRLVSVVMISAVMGCIPLAIQAAALGFKSKSNSNNSSGGAAAEAATSTSISNKKSSSSIAGTTDSSFNLQASSLYSSQNGVLLPPLNIGSMRLVTSGSTKKSAEPALEEEWDVKLGGIQNKWVDASQTYSPTFAMFRSHSPVFNSQSEIAIPGFGSRFMLASSGNGSSAAISPVPEPEPYLMLLAGVGLVGIMSRRKAIAAKRRTEIRPQPSHSDSQTLP